MKPITIESLKASLEIALNRYEDYCKMQDELNHTKEDLANRKIIERAKGCLMDTFNMKEKQAMEFMQKKSRSTNKKLVVIADEIMKMNEALNK